MANKEFVAELVGWVDNGFKDLESVSFDEEAARGHAGLVFGGAESTVQSLLFTYDRKRIQAVEAFFDVGLSTTDRPSVTRDANQKEFTFRKDERFSELSLYLSFSVDKETLPSNERWNRETVEFLNALSIDASNPQQSAEEHAQSDSALAVPDGAAETESGIAEDWGMNRAQLCGIYFKTTQNRKFRCIPSDPAVFKTRFSVDVGSGACYGILLEKPQSDSRAITGIGFLFSKEPTGAAAVSSGAAPCSGQSSPHVYMRKKACLGGAVRTTLRGIGRAVRFVAGLWRRLFASVPLSLVTLFVVLRILVMQVILPLYDVVSDLLAAYYYYADGEESFLYIALLIVFFVLLPHIIHSVALIWEMIVDVGEFDEFPSLLVRFYKSKPTPSYLLNSVFKFLSLPFFMLLNFLWFFLRMLEYAARALSKTCFSMGVGFVARVGARHPENLRAQNVKDDGWAKVVLMELMFETIPQLIVQISAFAAFYQSDDSKRSFPIISSMVVSVLNFAHQCWILHGFMRITALSFRNTVRIMLSSALDFFPIFILYKNAAEVVLFQFFDNPILLELWGPLRQIMMRNSTLKTVVLYIEDVRDWLEMSLQLLDSISVNEKMSVDTLDVCVEASNTEEAARVAKHMDRFKARFADLLKKKRVKRVYLLIDAAVDIGVVDGSVEETERDAVEVDGCRWTWKWPKEKTARIEYCIELIT